MDIDGPWRSRNEKLHDSPVKCSGMFGLRNGSAVKVQGSSIEVAQMERGHGKLSFADRGPQIETRAIPRRPRRYYNARGTLRQDPPCQVVLGRGDARAGALARGEQIIGVWSLLGSTSTLTACCWRSFYT